jgi:hypothetical protein
VTAAGCSAGAALALVLVALLLWTAAYAGELGSTGPAAKRRWGDLKCWRSSRRWCSVCSPTGRPTT